MKRLGFRLIGGYILALLMVAAVGFYSAYESRKSLQDAIGMNSNFLANQMLLSINVNIYGWLDRFEQRCLGDAFRNAAERSNVSFAALPAVGPFMDKREAAYAAGPDGKPSAAALGLQGEPLSLLLQTLYFDYYRQRGLDIVVPEAVVTNRHGAVIALTGAIARYRFDSDPLWLAAMASGTRTGETELDAKTGRVIIPMAIPIPDEQGRPIGVMMAKVFADALIVDAISAGDKYRTTQVRLMTEKGRLVHATVPFAYGDDVSTEAFFYKIRGDDGSFVADDGGIETLFAYSRVVDGLGFEGAPLVLLLSNRVSEVLAPSFVLRDRIIVASALFLTIGVIVALLIARTITRPVKALGAAMSLLAEGSLTASIDVRGKDELGDLSRSFVEMQDALRGITGLAERIAGGDLTAQTIRRSDGDALGVSLERMLTKLRSQTGEIKEGVNVLAASASQISASTSQFAANSSETAAAVSQTTATIEEVKQTTHLSNEKAKQVAESARKTEVVAQAGRNSVDETTKAMEIIRDHMGTIGASIVRLSDQGVTIGDITSTVSDLADQSNLLAVNAAIEAAKAGEQGRGFVVVAQEIKNLAEQSKRATVQVRGILLDLKNATGNAVMSTERGSKAVDHGMTKASEAKAAIEALTLIIEDAAMGAELIAVTSEQQLVGMDQVAIAMESIQAATAQGVEGTRQLETAALNLHGVGQRLKQLVDSTRM